MKTQICVTVEAEIALETAKLPNRSALINDFLKNYLDLPKKSTEIPEDEQRVEQKILEVKTRLSQLETMKRKIDRKKSKKVIVYGPE